MKGTASRFSLLIIFLLFFSSSSLSARELTKEEIDAVEVGVNKQLKDPYSAKYTHNSYMSDDHRGGVYCGKVNAKNSYGAYIGDRLFAVVF
ncbi:hypothetical protein PSR26_27160, partial [Enterobacter hormaechei subsp. steigerwaltii]|nr:hypothetical protein [Enterobacter hormaechei subsp. steigerwaltii]